MLQNLVTAFKDDIGISHLSSTIHAISELMDHFSEDYFNEKSSRNAAIDAVIEILQQCKDK